MANYITIAPQYNPFSLQELLAIPMMYTEAYNKAQEQYDAYQDKVAALRAYAKDSPAAASMLNAYDTGIQDLTNAMASGRWNTNVANQSRRLRSLYREQIIPLSIGATAFDTYRQNRLKRNDGTLIGKDYTLEDFINNPTLEDNSLLGSAIQAEAMKAAAVDASSRQVTPQWKLDRTRGGQYYTAEVGNGYTSSERAAFLQNPNDSRFSSLTAIRQQLRDKLGYANRTKAEQEQIDNYITRGIYDGMVGNVQWHDAINHGYSRPTSTGVIGTSTVGNTRGNTDDEAVNAGVFSYQKGGKLHVNGTYQRTLLPDDPYPSILDINQMTDAQYNNYLKHIEKLKQRYGVKTNRELQNYLYTVKHSVMPKIDNPQIIGSTSPRPNSYVSWDAATENDFQNTYNQYSNDVAFYNQYKHLIEEIDKKYPMPAHSFASEGITFEDYDNLPEVKEARKNRNAYIRKATAREVRYSPSILGTTPQIVGYGYTEAELKRRLANVDKARREHREWFNEDGTVRDRDQFLSRNNIRDANNFVMVSQMLTEKSPHGASTGNFESHLKYLSESGAKFTDGTKLEKALGSGDNFGYNYIGFTATSLANKEFIIGTKKGEKRIKYHQLSDEVKSGYRDWLDYLRAKYDYMLRGKNFNNEEMITYLNNMVADFDNEVAFLDDMINTPIKVTLGTDKLSESQQKELRP